MIFVRIVPTGCAELTMFGLPPSQATYQHPANVALLLLGHRQPMVRDYGDLAHQYLPELLHSSTTENLFNTHPRRGAIPRPYFRSTGTLAARRRCARCCSSPMTASSSCSHCRRPGLRVRSGTSVRGEASTSQSTGAAAAGPRRDPITPWDALHAPPGSSRLATPTGGRSANLRTASSRLIPELLVGTK